MHIVCTTTHAAAQVIDILFTAQLRPADAFAVHAVLSTTLPITFTMLTILTNAQWVKIRALADATIVG
jgi:hypothetical protein